MHFRAFVVNGYVAKQPLDIAGLIQVSPHSWNVHVFKEFREPEDVRVMCPLHVIVFTHVFRTLRDLRDGAS